MTKWISGREALQHLDRQVGRLRSRLGDAMEAADSIEGRMAEIQTDRVGALQGLARLRLDLIEQADIDDLDRVNRAALELLRSHADYVERERRDLDALSKDIFELESERLNLADQCQAIESEIENKLTRVQTDLNADKKYLGLLEAFEEAEAIADRAEQKLTVAIEERQEKSADYLEDPLFAYLWDRNFGTASYRGGGLFRLLDSWVAKLCGYDRARPNFARLNDITDWLTEHSEETRGGAEAAKSVLEAAEKDAIDNAGVPEDEQKTAELRAQIDAIDHTIEDTESRLADLTDQHARTLVGEDGPAKQAGRMIEQSLQRMSIPNLRKLAAETVTLDDDELVDDLVELRKEEMSLELETERISKAPVRLGEELAAFESLRRRFKHARFDSDAARLKSAIFHEAVESLSSGTSSVDRVLRHIQQSVRRKERTTREGFGGRRPGSDIQVHDILEVIAEEALKSAMRGGRRRGGFGGFPKRGRGTSRRSSSRRRGGGGFKTGGGF